MNPKDLELLKSFNPCPDGLGWAETQPSLDIAWKNCERGDWMLWALQKRGALDKERAVLMACDCAERVLHIYEESHPQDARPRKAIEAARLYLDGGCTTEALKEARAAAAHAYDAASDADGYAAATADAAAYAAYMATYAAADAAAYGRSSEQKAQSDIVRKYYPKLPKE